MQSFSAADFELAWALRDFAATYKGDHLPTIKAAVRKTLVDNHYLAKKVTYMRELQGFKVLRFLDFSRLVDEVESEIFPRIGRPGPRYLGLKPINHLGAGNRLEVRPPDGSIVLVSSWPAIPARCSL